MKDLLKSFRNRGIQKETKRDLTIRLTSDTIYDPFENRLQPAPENKV